MDTSKTYTTIHTITNARVVDNKDDVLDPKEYVVEVHGEPQSMNVSLNNQIKMYLDPK